MVEIKHRTPMSATSALGVASTFISIAPMIAFAKNDPYGGFGRMSGLVIALLILQTISSDFNLLSLSAQLTLVLWGSTFIPVMAVKRMWSAWEVRPR